MRAIYQKQLSLWRKVLLKLVKTSIMKARHIKLILLVSIFILLHLYLMALAPKKRDFKFIIVTNTIAEEAVYQEDDQNVEMDDVNILLAYEVVYDEHSDEWKVNAIGDEDIIESRYGDL